MVANDDLELLIFLLPLPRFWDTICVSSWLVCTMLVGAPSFVRDGQTFYLLNQASRSHWNFTFPLSDNVSLHPFSLIAPPPKTTLFILFFFLLLLFGFTSLGSLLVPVSQQYSLQCFQLRQKIPSSLWHSYGGICKHLDSGSLVSSDANQDIPLF